MWSLKSQTQKQRVEQQLRQREEGMRCRSKGTKCQLQKMNKLWGSNVQHSVYS